MIKFVDVSKTYEDSDTHALRGITLDIEDGEFVFIIGSSGAGKSTLLKLIMREQIPSSGSIIVDDQVINELPRKEVPYLRRKMGMVYQDFRLIDKMNVFENVAFAMHVIGKSQNEIKPRVQHILKLVGLEHKIKVRPNQLSGGEQQRVSLARAIVNKPKIVIADEPTANVDTEMSLEIVKLLKKINSDGTTVIIVTHDREIVKKAGGRIVEIEKGKVIFDTGTVKQESERSVNKDEKTADKVVADKASKKTSKSTTDSSIKKEIDNILSNAIAKQVNSAVMQQSATTAQQPPNTNQPDTGTGKALIKQDENSTEHQPPQKEAIKNMPAQQSELDTSKYDKLISEIKSEQIEKSAEQ